MVFMPTDPADHADAPRRDAADLAPEGVPVDRGGSLESPRQRVLRVVFVPGAMPAKWFRR